MAKKVCVVVTARPSYARVKSALSAIVEHAELELQLVVGASALLERFGAVVRVIEQDGFEVAAHAYMVVEGENLVTSAKSTGIGLMEMATILDGLKPDVVVTIADRYETLASAIAASYMNIQVAHIQGGEVTGSIDDKVRHAVTKLADLHFVSTECAARRVVSMGEPEESVFVTGCPSIDLAARILDEPALDVDIFKRYGGVGPVLDLSGGYIVVMQHPVTTEFSQARSQIEETLCAVRDLNYPALWFWPNVDAGSDAVSKGIRMFRENNDIPQVHLFKNLGPEDFLRVVNRSQCIVGNSSVAIRECAFLGVPAVNIGTRQRGRERGRNVIDVDYQRDQILAATRYQLNRGERRLSDTLYGDGHAGARIAHLLASTERGGS